MLKNGPSEKELAKVKEAQKLELKENMKKNRFWISNLYDMLYNQTDFNEMLTMEAEIDALTAEDIKAAANKYISENRIITVLMPEK